MFEAKPKVRNGVVQDLSHVVNTSFTLLQAGSLLPGNKIRIGKQDYQYFKSRDLQVIPNVAPSNGTPLAVTISVWTCRI